MKLPLTTTTGTKQGTIDLPDEVFGVKVNRNILAQYLRVYRSRKRKNAARTQTRATITGSTAKIWRQKGTGRARHGSRKAPIFVGGSKAHGPTGQENYQHKIPKKMKRAALFSALTSKLDHVKIITSLDKVSHKTKDLNSALKKITGNQNKKTTIILSNSNDPLIKSARNLESVATTQAARLNPYEVLNSNHLIFTKNSLETLKDTFLAKGSQTSNKKPDHRDTEQK